MIPFRKFDIPGFEVISAKLHTFINTYAQLGFFNRIPGEEVHKAVPEVQLVMDSLNMGKYNAVVFIKVAPDSHIATPPHTDGKPGYFPHRIGFNWPVSNYEEPETVYYQLKDGYNPVEYMIYEQQVKKGKVPQKNLPEIHFHTYKMEDVIESHRFILNTPTLIRVDVPHNVINKTNTYRMSASFRFDNPPWHLLEEQNE